MHPLLKEIERENDPHDALEIAPGVVLAARAEPEFPTLAPAFRFSLRDASYKNASPTSTAKPCV